MSQFWLVAMPPNPALAPDDEPGRIIGAGPDFWNFMNDPTEWTGISASLSVFQLDSDYLNWVPPTQMQTFYAWAADNHIPLSFNSGVIDYDDPAILNEIWDFERYGGTLSYISMDEPLGIATEEGNLPHLSIEEVALEAAANLKKILAGAPNAKIVDQEPVPATTPAHLAEWCRAFQIAMGRPLDGLQLDVNFGYGNSVWVPALVAAVQTLEAVGVPPEIIVDAEEPTDMGWTDDAILHYIMYRALFGNTIAAYVFQTWDPNPLYLLPDTNPASLTNVEYAAQFYDQVSSVYELVLGRIPTQTEYISALRALSAGIITDRQLQTNLETSSEGVTQTALYDGVSQTAIFLPGLSCAVTIDSNDETVIAANELTIINCPLADANDNFVGYSAAETFVELSGPGVLYPGWPLETLYPGGVVELGDLTSDVTFIMASDESINISESAGLAVVAIGTNDLVSMIWDAASLAATVTNGGPVVSGNSSTTVVVSGGGDVDVGNEISGVGVLDLQQLVAGNPIEFVAPSLSNITINDQNGGNTITVSNSTQAIENSGTVPTMVFAAADYANADVMGGSAGATLTVTSQGTFTLGAESANLDVVMPSYSEVVLNTMAFICADASAGDIALNIGGPNQTIIAGPSDVVTDPSDIGFQLNGSSTQLAGDLITGFNGADTIDIADFGAEYTLINQIAIGNLTVLKLQQGLTSLTLNFSGTFAAGSIYATQDGRGGTFISQTLT